MSRIGTLVGLMVYVLTMLTAAFPTLIPNSTALASGESYTANYDNSTKAALQSCMQNQKCDRSANGSLQYIYPNIVGGVYGNTPIQLKYEDSVDPSKLQADQFTYTGNYNCKDNGTDYTFSVLMKVYMNSLDNKTWPATLYIDHVTNNTTGKDITGVATGSDGNDYDYPLQTGIILHDSTVGSVPASCLPAGLTDGGNSLGYPGPAKITMTNYNKLSNAEKKKWPGVDSQTSLNGAGNVNNGGGGNLDCAISNALNWIICPAVDIMVALIDKVDTLINDQLALGTANQTNTDQPNAIFADSSGNCADPHGACASYYTAWSSFRDLALGLMVVAGLIILIAQALGVEVLDAYAIRKALPRLLVAAIAITLSWPLMKFAITLTNDLGYGVNALITGPFNRPALQLNTGTGIGTLLISGIGLTVLGPAGLLSFAITGFVAILTVMITLIIRQVVVTLLIILAPIAIVSYILPNTQRVFRMWSDNFVKLLLMFPLIVAFIAAGHVFAAITLKQNGGIVNQVVGFVAYFAPYFMIPLTFRMSGGIMSSLSGFVQNASQPVQGALAKGRASNRQKRAEMYNQKFRTGGFKTILPAREKGALGWAYRRNLGVVRGTNNLGRRFNAGLLRGGLGYGARGETAFEASLMEGAEHAAQEAPMKENATINGFNRLMVLMAKHRGNEAKAMADLRTWYSEDENEYNHPFEGEELEEKLSDAQARLRNVGGYNPARAVASYLAMGRDGTAIRDVRDSGQVAAWVSEGSTATAYNLVSQVASDSKRAGRSELSPSQENKAALVGATVADHAGRRPANFDSVIDKATMSGAGGEGAYTVLMNSPSRVVRGNVEHAMEIIQRYKDDPSAVPFEDAAQAATVIKDLQSQASYGYGKPDNRIALRDAMAAEGRQEILDDFMKSQAPTRGNNGEAQTASDYVQKLAGENVRGISESDRQAGMAEQDRVTREQDDANRTP